MRARVPPQQPEHRVGHVLEEGVRQAAGRHDAEGVAEQPGVLGGEPALLAAEPDAERAALGRELLQPGLGLGRRLRALRRLRRRQVADAPQHFVQRVGVPRPQVLRAVLQVVLHLFQRPGVDEVAQLLLPQQLAQQVAVQRERHRAPLGGRCVALVHVGGHVVEQQRGGEGRRRPRLHLDQRDLAGVDRAQQLQQAGHVEDVAQALAVRLEDHRELRIASRHLEQRLRLEPLLPERRAAPGVGARDEQRARGVLPEARAEQRAGAELRDHQVLRLVRLDEHQLGPGRVVGVGQVDDDAVVRPDRVGLEAEGVTDAGRERQRPRRVHAPAVGREDHQPPVADLVAEPLDDQRPVRRQHAGRGLLLAQEGEQVGCGASVEVVVALKDGLVLAHGPAGERADGLAELTRPAHALTVPEGDRARAHRGRRDDHAVPRDLLDAPRRRPEQERLPGARLVHHLLVQLARRAAVAAG